MEDFFKFPSTPHLITMPGVDVRGDKVLTPAECEEFLGHELTIEEKVDGANLGISFDSDSGIRAQNRGGYLHLPESGQWRKLDEWLRPRADTLFEFLSDRYILFGEWCYARHSIHYERLPDWFLGFDVYDRERRCFSPSKRRDHLFEGMGICGVPHMTRGRFSRREIEGLLPESRLTDGPAEGIYLRIEGDERLEQRAKVVRSNFIQGMERHWSHGGLKTNRWAPCKGIGN